MSDTALVTAEERAPINTSVEGMILAAIERGVPVETMERLLAMSERMKAESARSEYFEALSAFQDECPVIPKTKAVGSGNFSYKYAPLEVIVQTVQPILRRHGLSYRFDTAFEADPPAQRVICTVYHTAGHAEASEFRTPIDASGRMNDMQKSASAQTYAKRYAFINALGILTGDEDDDGRSGGERASMPSPAQNWQPRAGGAAPPQGAGSAPGTPVTRGKTISIQRPTKPMESVKDVLMQRGYSEQDMQPMRGPEVQDAANAEAPEYDIRQDARQQVVELAFEYMRGKNGSPQQGPGKGKAPSPSSILQAEVWANAAARKHFQKKLEELDADELVKLHDLIHKAVEG